MDHRRLHGAVHSQSRGARGGRSTEEETDVDPVVDDGARDEIIEWIDEATKEGATILTGGSVLEGRLLKPTVLGNVNLGMRVCREEVFGPVVTIDSYDTLDDAFLLANGTRYGLQAGIFTDSLPRPSGRPSNSGSAA